MFGVYLVQPLKRKRNHFQHTSNADLAGGMFTPVTVSAQTTVRAMSYSSLSVGQGEWSGEPGPGQGSVAPSLTPSRPAPPIPVQRSEAGAPPSRAGGGGGPAPGGVYGSTTSPYASNSLLSPSSSPSAGSYALPGTGAGSAQTIVRRGWISVKEDGLRAWIWSKRWLILREQTLSFYKNEVRARPARSPPTAPFPPPCACDPG